VAPPVDAQRLPLGEVVARARAAWPELEPRHVYPGGGGRPALVMGHAGAGALLRPRANVAAVDPFTGEVLGRTRAADTSAHGIIAHLADPLHFGTWAGFGSQIAWLVLGVGLTASVPLGVLFGVRRLGARRRPGVRTVYASTALVVAVTLAAAWQGYAEYRDWTRLTRVWPVASERLGPWRAQLLAVQPPGAPRVSDLRVHVRAGGGRLPDRGSVRLAVRDGYAVALTGDAGITATRFLRPVEAVAPPLLSARALKLTAEADGEKAEARFQLHAPLARATPPGTPELARPGAPRLYVHASVGAVVAAVLAALWALHRSLVRAVSGGVYD